MTCILVSCVYWYSELWTQLKTLAGLNDWTLVDKKNAAWAHATHGYAANTNVEVEVLTLTIRNTQFSIHM